MSSISTSLNGEPNHTISYTYDENGNRLTEVTNHLKWNTFRKKSYSYDNRGNQLTESVDDDGDGEPKYNLPFNI